MLFTNNETNMERLYQAQNRTPFVKDAFHRYLIEGERGAVNPEMKGTKAAGHFASEIPPGKSWTIRLRLMDSDPSDPLAPQKDYFGAPILRRGSTSGNKKPMNSTSSGRRKESATTRGSCNARLSPA